MQRTKDRLSFFLSRDLSQKVYKLSKQTRKTISDIARDAITSYLEQIEKEKIEKELEAGYQVNTSYFMKQQEEWEHADSE